MSIIVDDPAAEIAERVRKERERRGWSLADLAARSGVSKAMLSKIEREEASPTAVILLRIATAFGLTLAEMLAPCAAGPQRLLRAADQPQWRDPETEYLRRQVFQSADFPMELVEVHLPPGARVGFPASSYALIRQVVWVLSGRLEIRDGAETFTLKTGDRLAFGPPADSEFRNTADKDCRYLVAVLRR
ncbi:MAG: helix-turn-helix transcriptional regulator [Alphaproteobacteria bacterium]|nr:XRE family transcriptional regulator [Alphaproteobacteria bacterium]MDE2109779.1 helix-turn-helix transcriptional regulator [Alphaproteobacteria bacterium]MDE2495666.1 helix-turn-helix transcriptional regulator [Alphaproteobacteria bacterium]